MMFRPRMRPLIWCTKFSPDILGDGVELSAANTVATTVRGAHSDLFRNIAALDGTFSDTSHFAFAIRILKNAWCAFGLVEERKAKRYRYGASLGHGHYLIDSHSTAWHSTSRSINERELEFELNEGDCIQVHFNAGKLTWRKEKEELFCMTDITSDDALIPCVVVDEGSLQVQYCKK